ncbi:MAG: hypothetical protein AVDCRST_MAG91-139 [uncultured Sphingomonadaceae bacterium]|uniref:SpoVT-AbrB domain-containing protein n=1 Tax=uncultured Sphingomonadaceae bacterium TaxID=169976 RepID=A0A6J4S0T0_9SPHN|nr:MAG: hypothetical protein AVDCRST_MAG91-139 [uncultured Sphingomonadaceae bacterium]
MRTALRKMGNSAGMIIPRSILTQLDVEVGAKLEITVVDRAIVAKPITTHPREGWEEDARKLAEAGEDALTEDDLAWINTGNAFDAEWEW